MRNMNIGYKNVWGYTKDDVIKNDVRPVINPLHDGQVFTVLAGNFNVVVIETNHRLGLLGFLYLDEIAGPEYEGSGNMGVLDMIAGLKWVQKNIAEFGGDPDNVMIFGESGGGGKTSCLYTAPEAAPGIYIAIASIVMMGLGSVEIAGKKALQKAAPVYLYNFGYKSGANIPGTDYPMGTPHAMDISFKFNNIQPPREGEQPGRGFRGNGPDAYVASHNMVALWTTFARTGKLSAEGLPEWPLYDLNERPTMRINATCEVINDRFSRELELWRSIGRLKSVRDQSNEIILTLN